MMAPERRSRLLMAGLSSGLTVDLPKPPLGFEGVSPSDVRALNEAYPALFGPSHAVKTARKKRIQVYVSKVEVTLSEVSHCLRHVAYYYAHHAPEKKIKARVPTSKDFLGEMSNRELESLGAALQAVHGAFLQHRFWTDQDLQAKSAGTAILVVFVEEETVKKRRAKPKRAA
jgi:hypothetical protein